MGAFRPLPFIRSFRLSGKALKMPKKHTRSELMDPWTGLAAVAALPFYSTSQSSMHCECGLSQGFETFGASFCCWRWPIALDGEESLDRRHQRASKKEKRN